jgi:hypothetical protein
MTAMLNMSPLDFRFVGTFDRSSHAMEHILPDLG